MESMAFPKLAGLTYVGKFIVLKQEDGRKKQGVSKETHVDAVGVGSSGAWLVVGDTTAEILVCS